MIHDVSSNINEVIRPVLNFLFFFSFYFADLLFCSKRCQIKYNTLFHYEDEQQKRIRKYCD